LFKVNSIFFKINLIFILSTVTITLTASLIQFRTADHSLRKALKSYIQSGVEIPPHHSNNQGADMGRHFKIYKKYRPRVVNGELYVFNRDIEKLVPTGFQVEFNWIPTYIGGGLLLFITLLYLLIRRSLLPLKSLENSIKLFREGERDIEIEIVSNDEIGRVGMEFQKAVQHIEMLKRSRELFLRNIIHELKTPITKGKLFVALNSDVDLETLDRVFNRLDSLINELASVERLTSREVELDFRRVESSLILKEAIQLGFFDSVETLQIEKSSIIADYKLLPIAFKNLIDNGIRYSSDGRVKVKLYANRAEFLSRGEPLKRELSEYVQPFSHSQITSNRGFGLGLYLVNEIALRHSMTLHYRAEDEVNIFTIVY
jgi:two-component system OmpR family sensor kinase